MLRKRTLDLCKDVEDEVIMREVRLGVALDGGEG